MSKKKAVQVTRSRRVVLDAAATYGIVVAIATVGLVAIPTKHIVDVTNYTADVAVVWDGFAGRMRTQTAATLLLWLLPIPVAMWVPRSVTDVPLRVAAVALVLLFGLSLVCVPGEAAAFGHLLRNEPAMGYMWHDVFLICLSVALYTTRRPLLIAGLPMSVVAFFEPANVAPARTWVLIPLATLVSVALVLPTAARFVVDDTLFLSGYTTASICGNILSVGLVLCWVGTYHRVCEQARHLVQRRFVVRGILWALCGTALVLLYVSSAWALHLCVAVYIR